MFLASLASSLMKTDFHVPFSLLELYWCLIKIANRLLVLLEGDYIIIHSLVVFNSAEGSHIWCFILPVMVVK